MIFRTISLAIEISQIKKENAGIIFIQIIIIQIYIFYISFSEKVLLKSDDYKQSLANLGTNAILGHSICVPTYRFMAANEGTWQGEDHQRDLSYHSVKE